MKKNKTKQLYSDKNWVNLGDTFDNMNEQCFKLGYMADIFHKLNGIHSMGSIVPGYGQNHIVLKM